MTKPKASEYKEFREVKWELRMQVCAHMTPAHYVYIQGKLAEILVEMSKKDVLAGWSIKCPTRLCKHQGKEQG